MSEVKLGRVAPIYKGVYDETTAYNSLDRKSTPLNSSH